MSLDAAAAGLGSSSPKAPRRPPPRTKPASFAVGAKVEAKFQGGDDYYPGTIAEARGDGTYDIHYDVWRRRRKAGGSRRRRRGSAATTPR